MRPLTPAGQKRSRRAARGLRRIGTEVDLLLSSPYTRAWQTAEILHEEAGWPAPEQCAALEAVREPADAAEELVHRREASVALVGHEPQLSSLVSLLLTGHTGSVALDLKKGGVVLLDCAREPAPGEALLRWFASPKILRSLD
jgi:phosphohistidine phosphatase